MTTENNRIAKKIESAIKKFSLDLDGLTTLTEVGTGVFSVTPILAALAGSADVVAVTRDSRYGLSEHVINKGRELASYFGVENKILFTSDSPCKHASKADIITNLGFVRPIDKNILDRVKPTAVIPLMWEPWEFRPADIDLAECKKRGIVVIGTRESEQRLRTFEFVGILAIKLLMDRGVEILFSNILVYGSEPFGSAVKDKLASLGANVLLMDDESFSEETLDRALQCVEAVVVVEHRSAALIVGDEGMLKPDMLVLHSIELIHICGLVDDNSLKKVGLKKHPLVEVEPGYMTYTTDYVGYRPVVDLHAAGLKVGEICARQRLIGNSEKMAIEAAEQAGIGLKVEIDGFL